MVGVLMGDGTIQTHGKNPFMRVSVKEESYIRHLEEKFGWLCGGVNCRENQYGKIWELNTRRHPKIIELEEWYSSGEKVWPKDIKFTPTVLKHLYACDGHLQKNECRGICIISLNNERDRVERVCDRIEEAGLPRPRIDKNDMSCNIRWSVSESVKVLEYMGKPLSGYEYKWNTGE